MELTILQIIILIAFTPILLLLIGFIVLMWYGLIKIIIRAIEQLRENWNG